MKTRLRTKNSDFVISLEPKNMKPKILSKSKLMGLILKGEQYKTEFENTEIEDKLVELFTQVKEIPEGKEREIDKLGGNIARFGIEFETFDNKTLKMYNKQKQLLSNYAHNVEGEIYKALYYGKKGEYGQTLYIAVPADAPIVEESEDEFIDCFSDFINNYDEIMTRYSLRYIIKNKSPDRSIEENYIGNFNASYQEEIRYSFGIAIFLAVVYFVQYVIFRM